MIDSILVADAEGMYEGIYLVRAEDRNYAGGSEIRNIAGINNVSKRNSKWFMLR